MKKIIMLFVCCFLLIGCSNDSNELGVKKINCKEKDELVKNGALLIDVRTNDEYNVYHLENSINISSDSIEYNIGKIVDNFDKEIIVYCQSGNRSATVADELFNMGYKKIYDLGSINNCEVNK